jgi:hypothetical protein
VREREPDLLAYSFRKALVEYAAECDRHFQVFVGLQSPGMANRFASQKKDAEALIAAMDAAGGSKWQFFLSVAKGMERTPDTPD